MKYKGIIFDLDGTLVNSIEDIADAMNIMLLSYNYPVHSYETYKKFVGSGLRSLVIKALPEAHRDNAQINLCFDAMKDIYSNHCTIKTRPYDGVMDLLDQLKLRRIKLSILSNKADVLTKKVASHLFPDYFETVAGLTTEALKKPNPVVALDISKTMGIAPEDLIFIGDTGIDIQTAKNANMLAIGVSWGFRSKEELNKSGAKHILNQPSDLLNILG